MVDYKSQKSYHQWDSHIRWFISDESDVSSWFSDESVSLNTDSLNTGIDMSADSVTGRMVDSQLG